MENEFFGLFITENMKKAIRFNISKSRFDEENWRGQRFVDVYSMSYKNNDNPIEIVNKIMNDIYNLRPMYYKLFGEQLKKYIFELYRKENYNFTFKLNTKDDDYYHFSSTLEYNNLNY